MGGRKSLLFPEVHENVGKCGNVFFAHGAAFDFKKDVLVKLKVITKQSEFKEDK